MYVYIYKYIYVSMFVCVCEYMYKYTMYFDPFPCLIRQVSTAIICISTIICLAKVSKSVRRLQNLPLTCSSKQQATTYTELKFA